MHLPPSVTECRVDRPARLRPERIPSLSETIAQGAGMRRPGLLEAHAEKQDGTVIATCIGGRYVRRSGIIDLA
jgi:predicted PhzF superfamily epimerase YddE/YHI9